MTSGVLEAKKSCVLCGGSFDEFLSYGIPPRPGRCPLCGAKGRHRALSVFVRRRLLPRLTAGREVLEVGATPKLLARLAGLWSSGGARYTAVDLFRPARAAELEPPNRFLVMDARRLAFPDSSFDLVLCCNVLSFVREADALLSEVRRVLKPEGLSILTVHRVAGPTVSAERYSEGQGGLTREYLAENGSAWFFGDDYGARLRRLGLASVDIPLPAPLDAPRARVLGLERQPTLTLAARDEETLAAWLEEAP